MCDACVMWGSDPGARVTEVLLWPLRHEECRPGPTQSASQPAAQHCSGHEIQPAGGRDYTFSEKDEEQNSFDLEFK